MESFFNNYDYESNEQRVSEERDKETVHRTFCLKRFLNASAVAQKLYYYRLLVKQKVVESSRQLGFIQLRQL